MSRATHCTKESLRNVASSGNIRPNALIISKRFLFEPRDTVFTLVQVHCKQSVSDAATAPPPSPPNLPKNATKEMVILRIKLFSDCVYRLVWAIWRKQYRAWDGSAACALRFCRLDMVPITYCLYRHPAVVPPPPGPSLGRGAWLMVK